MTLFTWLRARSPKTAPRPRPRLGVHHLEDRTVPSWLAQIGGPGVEYPATPHAADAAGNVYVGGRFEQTAQFGTDTTLTSSGEADGFVARYTPAGTLAWARRFGGTLADEVSAISADPSGRFAYVTGSFQGTADFAGPGTAGVASKGRQDVFLLKLDAATGQTVWARTLGSAYVDRGRGLATDGATVYVTGSFQWTADFDPGPLTRNLTSAGATKTHAPTDAFVWALDAAGNYAAAWQIGGTSDDHGESIVLDGGGVFVQGDFKGTADFDPSTGVRSRTSTPSSTSRNASPSPDLFIARYTTAGALAWVQTIGGPDYDTDYSLAAAGGALVLRGSFSGCMDFDPGPGGAALDSGSGYSDVVVAKYAEADGSLVWARQFGAAGNNEFTTRAFVADPLTGAMYFGMNFVAPVIDLDPARPGGEFANAGEFDGLLVKLDVGGNYLAAWQVGGPGFEGGVAPVGLVGGTVYTAGRFAQTAAFPTGGTLTSRGEFDMYVMALDDPAPRVAAFSADPTAGPAGGAVTLTATTTGAVTRVAFYADSNNDGRLDPATDTLLGYGTATGSGTWTLALTTADWAPGTYRLFARAEDAAGAPGNVLDLTLTLSP